MSQLPETSRLHKLNAYLASMITPRGIAYRQFFIALLFLGTALLIYRALQSEYVYYELLDRPYKTWRWDSNIDFPNLFELPYPSITKKDLSRWDADHYHHIAVEGYGVRESSYAFFPLFPWLYRLFGSNPYLICIVNWLLFITAWLILLRSLAPNLKPNLRIALYAVGVALPSVVCFAIPYTESTYFFAAIAFLVGLHKRWPLLWVIGGMMLGLTRPALLILVASLVCIEGFRFLLKPRPLKHLSNLAITILPLIGGTAIAVAVQMQSGAGPFKFITVLEENWGTSFELPGYLGSWSHSGHMLELMGVFGISMLALADVANTVWRNLRAVYIHKTEAEDFTLGTLRYLELLAAVCLIGQGLSIIFLQHSNTHGATRYIYATPYLYIWGLMKLQRAWQTNVLKRTAILGYLLVVTLFAWGFLTAEHFSDVPVAAMSLPFNGTPWMLLAIGIALFLPQMNHVWRRVFIALLFVTSGFYCSFLLMCFIGNGLIWT